MCLLLCVLQWEELQGGFEQLDYLREILKDHIGEGSANIVQIAWEPRDGVKQVGRRELGCWVKTKEGFNIRNKLS